MSNENQNSGPADIKSTLGCLQPSAKRGRAQDFFTANQADIKESLKRGVKREDIHTALNGFQRTSYGAFQQWLKREGLTTPRSRTDGKAESPVAPEAAPATPTV